MSLAIDLTSGSFMLFTSKIFRKLYKSTRGFLWNAFCTGLNKYPPCDHQRRLSIKAMLLGLVVGDYSAVVPIKAGDAPFLSVKAGMNVTVKHL